MLAVHDLSKRYGTVEAVEGISFEIAAGELFTVLGPSGCGKTTILRCIAGLEKPDAGEIFLDGELVFSAERGIDVPANRRGLGLVFQSYAIWPHMNVFDNVAFPLTAPRRKDRLSQAEIRARVSAILDVVELGGAAHRPATELSGGERQRLALARALVGRPRLLLLDEPLSSLDAKLREAMRFELKRLQADLGVTAIYVTHDQAEALALSDRIAVMSSGRLEQVGYPRDIYERPASRLIADFIGAANVIEGIVDGRHASGAATVSTAAGELRVPWADAFPAGSQVAVVVRPEHVELSALEADASEGTWAGTIVGTAYKGYVSEHLVDVGGLELRAQASPSEPLQPGSSVLVRFRPEHCLLVAGDGASAPSGHVARAEIHRLATRGQSGGGPESTRAAGASD